MTWKSELLQDAGPCDDDFCPVCMFLRGERTQDVLMSVINQLDEDLAERESKYHKLADKMLSIHQYLQMAKEAYKDFTNDRDPSISAGSSAYLMYCRIEAALKVLCRSGAVK